jgi:hypothetical protein
MKIEMRRLMWCGLLGALALMPQALHAQATACGNAIPAPTDGRGAEHTVYSIPASTTHWFTVQGFAGNSYSVEVFDPFDSGANLPLPTIFKLSAFNTGTCTGTAFTTTDTTFHAPGIDNLNFGNFAGRRVSFTVAAKDDYLIAITSGGTGFFYTLTATETTLFSTRWSTFSGFFTSYGFTNTTDTAISVTLTLTNTAGTPVATSTQSVPAGRVIYTTTSALGVAVNDSGSASLTHNGPPGAILADAILANFGTSPPTTLVSKFEGRHAGH